MKPFYKLVKVELGSGYASASLDLDLSTVVRADDELIVEFLSSSCERRPTRNRTAVIVVVDKNDSAVVQHYPVIHASGIGMTRAANSS